MGGLIHCKALLRSVSQPVLVQYAGTGILGDSYRGIGRSGIDQQDLVTERKAAQAILQLRCGVLRDDDGGKGQDCLGEQWGVSVTGV